MILIRLFLCLMPFVMQATQNLEESPHPFVAESRRITLSEFPDAFNPSIIRWKGRLLMSFRTITNPKDSYNTSEIGLVWLDEGFNPTSTPYLISCQESLLRPHRAEDARLIEVGQQLFMIYSGNEDPLISKTGFRVYVAELKEELGKFIVSRKDRLTQYERNNQGLREKNWTPFDYLGTLHLSYSLNPHLVFKPLLGTEVCETVASSFQSLAWKWGEMRGGTQSLRMEDRYLTFFHSSVRMASEHSKGEEMLHYFMGACTFECTPPFAMTHISPEPIVGNGFFSGLSYPPYWGSWRGIFPGGFIFDDEYIWIFYGRQNHEIWVVKLDKEELLESLVPVFE